MRQEAQSTITTTLYDVISALHTQMGVEDDQVITAIVAHLMQTGQLTFRRSGSADHAWLERYDESRRHDAASLFPSRVDRQLASTIA